MKNAKKLIIGALFATVLAACGTNSETSAPASGSTTGGDSSGTSQEREFMEISFLAGGSRLEGDELESDPAIEYIEKKFNVSFDFIYEPSPTELEVYTKLNMMMGNKEVPDVMCMRTDQTLPYTCVEDLVDSGYLVNVQEYVNQRSESFPNLSKIVNATDTQTYRSSDGNLYIIPKKYVYDHAFIYRQDWLDKLGLSMPTNEVEFKNVLQAFVDNDPDGAGTTGLAMCYGFWFEHMFAGFTGAHRFYEQDGALRSVWDATGNRASQMIDAIKYCADLYQNKLLFQDVFTATQKRDEYTLFETGRAGCLLTGIASMNEIYPKLIKNFPDAKVSYGVWNGPAGIARVTGGVNYYTGTSINAKSGKADRIMEIFEWLLSEEGETLMTKGIEGVHYNVEGGKIIPNLEAEGIDQYTSPSKHAFRQWLDGTFVFDEMTDTQEWTKGMADYYEKECVNATGPSDPTDGYYALLPKRYQATIGNKPELCLQKWEGYFISGKKDGKDIEINETTFAEAWKDLKTNKMETLAEEYSKLVFGS